MYRSMLSITMMMLITASFSQASSKQGGASTPLVNQARETLGDIGRTAATVAREAEEVEQMSHDNRLGWQSHAAYLNRIKEDMNQIGREVAQLESEQESLAPWEREALVRTVPVLKDAAENTDRAIQFLNGNLTNVWVSGTYAGYTQKIIKDSEQVEKTLHYFAKLDKATRQEKQSRERLSMESGS